MSPRWRRTALLRRGSNLTLSQPGLRIPLTADAKMFTEAVALGNEVIWLHCYGEQFADPAAGRPEAGTTAAKRKRAYDSG